MRRRTYKRYLGQSSQVTFARLEQEAQKLAHVFSLPALAHIPEPRQDQQSALLPAPRLSPPRLPSGLVVRSRLLQELDAARTHSLTLLSAFAGSGKTTLLSAWVASVAQAAPEAQHDAADEPVVAWLSLDALDNDPIRLWSLVIAALQTRLPAIGQTAQEMMHAQEPPSLSTVLSHLLHEVQPAAREIILILDDYQVLEEQTCHVGRGPRSTARQTP
jgi:LuxR family maltose regulon positive regulatory protein